MVTAPAPAAADLHAPPAAAALAELSPLVTSATFESVLQNLPVLPQEPPGTGDAQSAHPKTLGRKKEVNTLNTGLADTSGWQRPADPQRAWAPAALVVPEKVPAALPKPAVAEHATAQAADPQVTTVAPAVQSNATSARLVKSITGQSGSRVAQTVREIPSPVPSHGQPSSLERPGTAVNLRGSADKGEAALQDPAILPEQSGVGLPRPVTPVRQAIAQIQPITAAVEEPQPAQARPGTSVEQPTSLRVDTTPTDGPFIAASAATSTLPPLTPRLLLNHELAPGSVLATLGAPTVVPAEAHTAPAKSENDSRQVQAETSRTAAAGPLPEHAPQNAAESVVNNKGLSISLAPRSDNLAFSLRLASKNAPQNRTQPTPQPAAARNQTNEARSDTRSAAPPSTNFTHETTLIKAASEVTARTPNVVWNEPAVVSPAAPRGEVRITDQHESGPASAEAVLRDIPVMPDAPRSSVTGEILLQLGGKDQPAAIRLTDRAGAVNVSVHAADPDLRNSLRSNLGELASQLSHQGWKTEVVKTGAAVTQGESARDSHPDGQRSAGQHQSSAQDGRQQQRERRGNGGQWLAQFEESLSQDSSSSGGTN